MNNNANNNQNINNSNNQETTGEQSDKNNEDIGKDVERDKLVNEKQSHTEEYEKRFSIDKLALTALWTWNVKVDNCSICRNHIMELCIECQARTDVQGEEECPISWGACNHAFHYHCISRWTQSRAVCPLDQSQWKFAKLGN